MEERRDKQNNTKNEGKKKEGCPLCEVSEETLGILKKAKKEKREDKKKKAK